MTKGQIDYDVIVAGGGSAGVTAAVASARSGARTLLIERFSCLGGAATMRNVVTYCGLYTLGDEPRLVVRGLADEIIHGLKAKQSITDPIRHRGVFVVFEPEALKVVLDDLVAGSGADVLFGAFAVAAERANGAIRSVTVASHAGLTTFRAKAFVDCTGDGDLAFFGGAATRYGNSDGVNLGTLGTRFGGVPASVKVRSEAIADAVDAKGFAPGQVTKKSSVVARLPVSGDVVVYLASEDYDPRDMTSMSRAEQGGRRQAFRYLDAIRTIDGCSNAYIVSTGPEFGTRESRHLNCKLQLTWANIQARKDFDDCIALGAWGAEWHDRKTYQSSFDFPSGAAPYQIPMRCLQSFDTTNLFCAGRLADGDRKAGAAIRVMGTAMATGHAAGLGAALQANGSYNVTELRKALVSQGADLEA